MGRLVYVREVSSHIQFATTVAESSSEEKDDTLAVLNVADVHNRIVNPNHVLQAHPPHAEATKEVLAEAAMVVAAAAVAASEAHLLATDVRSSSITSVPSYIARSSASLLLTDGLVTLHRWLARSEGPVPPSW